MDESNCIKSIDRVVLLSMQKLFLLIKASFFMASIENTMLFFYF